MGAAIAAYDYVVNTLLWDHFLHSLPVWQLCLLPLLGMFLTGLLLTVFKVPSSSMADEVVLAFHRPKDGIPLSAALPKTSVPTTRRTP